MWDAYFLEKKDIEIDRGTFRVYFSKPPIQNGPVLLLLHGGGFSALTWSLFTVSFSFFFGKTSFTNKSYFPDRNNKNDSLPSLGH